MTVKKVYIQLSEDGIPLTPCGMSLWEGSRFLGLSPEGFREEQIADMELDPTTLVHGWIRTVHAALKKIDAEIPPPLDYPESLRPFLGRNVELTTLKRVHDDFVLSEQSPDGPTKVFIKPLKHKLFKGHTVERFSHLAETTNIPGDEQVWRSGLVDFVSEWRCFVSRGGLIGVKNYMGDPWIIPDKRVVTQMVATYRDAPKGCSIDVGVDSNGKTLLVEVNDGYSLGSYGLDPLRYTELVTERWEEMVERCPRKR